jgi:hypothetical protein
MANAGKDDAPVMQPPRQRSESYEKLLAENAAYKERNAQKNAAERARRQMKKTANPATTPSNESSLEISPLSKKKAAPAKPTAKPATGKHRQ